MAEKKLSEELRHCLEDDYCGDCRHHRPETMIICEGLLQKAYELVKRYEEMEEQGNTINLPFQTEDEVWVIDERKVHLYNEWDCSGGWILCENKMPEIGKPVLVCDKQGNVCVRAITCEIKGKKYWSQDKYDVVAWQPLPEPYHEP